MLILKDVTLAGRGVGRSLAFSAKTCHGRVFTEQRRTSVCGVPQAQGQLGADGAAAMSREAGGDASKAGLEASYGEAKRRFRRAAPGECPMTRL